MADLPRTGIQGLHTLPQNILELFPQAGKNGDATL
jgi:hypothetical protein